jgi:hypothetical protein
VAIFLVHTRRGRGQSVVEFALVLPLMLFLALAVIDLARIYTTMLSVESAAREAADYGTFGSEKWADSSVPFTESDMRTRACVASSDLPDYVGPDGNCSNPSFAYCLSGDGGATCVPYSAALACDDSAREPPCRLSVTLAYTFDLIVPLNIEIGGVEYGLPSSLTFARTSTFPMTDLDLDP